MHGVSVICTVLMDIAHPSARALPLFPRALRTLTSSPAQPGPARARRVPPSFAMERPAIVTRSKAAAAIVAQSNKGCQQQQDAIDSGGGQAVGGARRRRRSRVGLGGNATRAGGSDDEELSELSSALSELSPVPSDLSDTEWQQPAPAREKPKVKARAVGSATSSYFRPGAELGSVQTGLGGTALGKRRRSPAGVGAELGPDKPALPVGRELRVERSKRKRIANAPQIEDVEAEVEELELKDSEDSKGKKPARPKKRNIVRLSPPPHWEEMYDLVREMRSRTLAPVDTMGCERLALRAGGQITPQVRPIYFDAMF